jgi:ubiquinone/menaquinone biosynthesis C-methylase UbiE
MTIQQPIDQARAEAFAGQVVGLMNSTGLSFMISIAHQTGLFDTMAELPPSTSEEIAAKAGLNERYVRECLGALVTGRIVEYDAAGGTYRLPPEHAAYLTRAAGTNNMSVMAMFFPEFGKVEQQVVQAFREGGGVPYSEFKRFHAIMREDSAQVLDATLLDVTLPLVPGLVERLRSGAAAADVGCGSGRAINIMARAFPASRFVGYDISEEAIGIAREEAKAWGLSNASFEVKDAAQLDLHDEFDLVTTIDAVHDQAHPAEVLRGVYQALKPGGVYLCVDIAASSKLEENTEHPLGPFIYAVSTMHCMTVSLAYDGVGLGTAWGQQKALEMLGEAGFKDIEVKQVEGDFFNNYYVSRK